MDYVNCSTIYLIRFTFEITIPQIRDIITSNVPRHLLMGISLWARTQSHVSLKACFSSNRKLIYQPYCSKPAVIFSGIQPTGVPHLGNYLGAFRPWVNLQHEASPTTQLYFSIADLHAITSQRNPEHLRAWKRQMLATLIAVGLDPERSTLFYQSSVLLNKI